MVTAGTYQKRPFFRDPEHLKALHGGLLKYARKYHWRMEAWAVFPNHYHFVAHAPVDSENGATSLRNFLADFHQHSAAWINRSERISGRKVWHNFWETKLTYEKSFLARLNYVHQNAVKHGLAPVANAYPWCSAAWFERTATPAQVKTVYGFKTDRIHVIDDF
jgi:putative transposase